MTTPATEDKDHEDRVAELKESMLGDPFEANNKMEVYKSELYDKIRYQDSEPRVAWAEANKEVVNQLNRIKDSNLEDIKNDFKEDSEVYKAIKNRDTANSEYEKHVTRIREVENMLLHNESRVNQAKRFRYGVGFLEKDKQKSTNKAMEKLLNNEIAEREKEIGMLKDGSMYKNVSNEELANDLKDMGISTEGIGGDRDNMIQKLLYELESKVKKQEELLATYKGEVKATGGTRKRSRRKNKKSKIHHKKLHHKKSKTHRKRNNKKTHRKY